METRRRVVVLFKCQRGLNLKKMKTRLKDASNQETLKKFVDL